jgi:hypothetical protein
MNNLYKRPMFRKGGSAEGGITSGLSTPKRGMVDGPGSYAGIDMNQNVEQALRNASLGDLKTMADQMYSPSAGTRRPQRRFNDFLIDFGLDIASRPAEGNIFQTAALSAKDPFKRFQDARSQEELLMEQQKENLEGRRSDMFKTLIEGQSDILAEKSGNTSYKDLEIARELRSIMPRFVELKKKRENKTLEEGEDLELKMLQEDYNRFSAKNLEDDLLMEIYADSLGERAIPNREEELFNADLKSPNRKYKNNKDPQIKKDAIESIRIELQGLRTYASGGRAGYAQGEMVEEQVTETETMDQGPMAQSDNPISYDQLRARLPNQITDDIVELMANSAEALEDFAMISSQQDVDLFNQKYSVNLVLPSEA